MTTGPDCIKIGEAASQAGVSHRTLRYYEELGLISPISRSEGGFRLYSDDEVETVKLINQFQKLGYSLCEIREMFQSKGKQRIGREFVHELKAVLVREKEKILEKFKILIQMEVDIAHAIKLLDGCCECEDCDVNPDESYNSTCTEFQHIMRDIPGSILRFLH